MNYFTILVIGWGFLWKVGYRGDFGVGFFIKELSWLLSGAVGRNMNLRFIFRVDRSVVADLFIVCVELL